MPVSIVHCDALTSLGYGQSLFERLIAGRSGLSDAAEVYDTLPDPKLAGKVGTLPTVIGEMRIPQILDAAFDTIIPKHAHSADLIVGGCSLGDLSGPDAGNPHAALTRAIRRHWSNSIPPVTLVSSACSSGTDAIITASQAIISGLADIVLVLGFDSLGSGKLIQHIALGTQSPDQARPFDASRSGTSFGEACGAMLLASTKGLERLCAVPVGQVAGYGITADAHDIAAPHPDGFYAGEAIKLAIQGKDTSLVGYVNTHGSGTGLNDLAEAQALRLAFGDRLGNLSIGGTKGALGHSLGATGVVEAVITLQSIRNKMYPPTTGLITRDPEIGIDVLTEPVIGTASVRYGLSTTFGFGGVNSALLLESIP